MKEAEIRLECLRIAAGVIAMSGSRDVVAEAQKIYDFVTSADRRPPFKAAA